MAYCPAVGMAGWFLMHSLMLSTSETFPGLCVPQQPPVLPCLTLHIDCLDGVRDPDISKGCYEAGLAVVPVQQLQISVVGIRFGLQ
jgi:hypothetical protein